MSLSTGLLDSMGHKLGRSIGVKLRGLEPFPGRPQGIAPTILRLAFRREVALGAASCIVGAIPCGRPLPQQDLSLPSLLPSLHAYSVVLCVAPVPFPPVWTMPS